MYKYTVRLAVRWGRNRDCWAANAAGFADNRALTRLNWRGFLDLAEALATAPERVILCQAGSHGRRQQP